MQVRIKRFSEGFNRFHFLVFEERGELFLDHFNAFFESFQGSIRGIQGSIQIVIDLYQFFQEPLVGKLNGIFLVFDQSFAKIFKIGLFSEEVAFLFGELLILFLQLLLKFFEGVELFFLFDNGIFFQILNFLFFFLFFFNRFFCCFFLGCHLFKLPDFQKLIWKLFWRYGSRWK